ncbi:UXS1 [Mytilus edulis]|uniref:UDP-glucuronate decarboxylase n=1 Tax=Mytilus edulis TaxID=6550 RepID=A0A8S3SGU6_MYTED|nr:UXS1 [Mytilus edulis]
MRFRYPFRNCTVKDKFMAITLFGLILIVWFGNFSHSVGDIERRSVNNDLFNEIENLKRRVQELEHGSLFTSFSENLARSSIMLACSHNGLNCNYGQLYNYSDLFVKITGGAGFVGSHLVDRLMMEGHEVTVVDNFFTGRKRNVEHWIGHENFELLNHDVINPLFIEASTSEVYGDPEIHPQNEDYWGHVNPIGPRACYDEGKRVAETMCYAYHRQDGTEIRVARIFNTFGPRMHLNDGRVVSNFILQSLQDKPITIYGEGKQTRSFQYVSDLVDGLIRLMNSNYSMPVNIGNPDEYTIGDFAKIIKGLVGGNSKIVKKPPMTDDPRKRKPDITRAKNILGWSPKVQLEVGLNRTIEYFKNELRRTTLDGRHFTKLPGGA